MNWNNLVRQTHRWVSVAFTLAVLFTFVALGLGHEPPFWVYLFVLVPLFTLLFSGLYLFAVPYLVKWRGPRGASPA